MEPKSWAGRSARQAHPAGPGTSALGDQEGVVRASGKKTVGRAPPPGWGADTTSLHKQQHPPTLSRGRDTSGRRAGCRAPGHMTTCLHFRGAPLQGSGRLGILLKPRGPVRGSFLPVGWRVDWSTPMLGCCPEAQLSQVPVGPCTWQCWWQGQAQTWRLGPSPVVTGRTVGQQRRSVLSGLR